MSAAEGPRASDSQNPRPIPTGNIALTITAKHFTRGPFRFL